MVAGEQRIAPGKAQMVRRVARCRNGDEAAAADPTRGVVYMTEDVTDGCFYRFTPDAYPSLASGLLEVAVVGSDRSVTWRAVPKAILGPWTVYYYPGEEVVTADMGAGTDTLTYGGTTVAVRTQ